MLYISPYEINKCVFPTNDILVEWENNVQKSIHQPGIYSLGLHQTWMKKYPTFKIRYKSKEECKASDLSYHT